MSPLGAARSPPPTCAPCQRELELAPAAPSSQPQRQLQPRGTARRTLEQHPVERLKRRLHYGVPDDGGVVEQHEGAAERHRVVSRARSPHVHERQRVPGLRRGEVR